MKAATIELGHLNEKEKFSGIQSEIYPDSVLVFDEDVAVQTMREAANQTI